MFQQCNADFLEFCNVGSWYTPVRGISTLAYNKGLVAFSSSQFCVTVVFTIVCHLMFKTLSKTDF
jgi:hypothetical protein